MSQSLFARITSHPIAFDGASGADVLAQLPVLVPQVAALVQGAAGCSPYLKSLILRERDWLLPALEAPPEASFDRLLAALVSVPLDQLSFALRQAKRRAALLTALCDLGGVWGVMQVTGALTSLADRAVDLSMKTLVAEEIRRGKLPGAGPDDIGPAAGMVVLALGKMGAAEPDYSSDTDHNRLLD